MPRVSLDSIVGMNLDVIPNFPDEHLPDRVLKLKANGSSQFEAAKAEYAQENVLQDPMLVQVIGVSFFMDRDNGCFGHLNQRQHMAEDNLLRAIWSTASSIVVRHDPIFAAPAIQTFVWRTLIVRSYLNHVVIPGWAHDGLHPLRNGYFNSNKRLICPLDMYRSGNRTSADVSVSRLARFFKLGDSNTDIEEYVRVLGIVDYDKLPALSIARAELFKQMVLRMEQCCE